MARTGFDIRSLLEFDPPAFRCERCLGLVVDGYMPFGVEQRCPVCKVEYVDACGNYCIVEDFLERRGKAIKFENLTGHARSLADTAMCLEREGILRAPPLYVLHQCLTLARHFVHFVTWGMDFQMLGALKLASHSAPIAGVISNADANLRAELVEHHKECPQFEARTYKRQAAGWGDPHQKLIVIDGLLAFTGSANLTMNSWRKSADARDLLEVVTDVDRVRLLNNRYFAPLWAELSGESGPVDLHPQPVGF